MSHRHPTRLSPQALCRGFSLLEMLVVITLVSVLVAMLLPALAQAKAAALHMKCAAQLHTHGIAHSTYQADFKDYYPSFGGPVVNDYSTWYRTNGSGNGANSRQRQQWQQRQQRERRRGQWQQRQLQQACMRSMLW